MTKDKPVDMIPLECPRCGGRALDISTIPKEQISVGVKCPLCHNIVHVPCTEASVKKPQRKTNKGNYRATEPK